MADSEASSGFSLAGTDGSFNSKTKDIFASFDAIEAKHSAVQKTQGEDKDLYKDDPEREKLDWGRARVDRDGFKRPKLPPPRSRSPLHPDHQKRDAQQRQYRQYVRQRGHCERGGLPLDSENPEKWTKYDLTNVPEVSDRSNSRAAMNFLNEMRDREKSSAVENLEGAEAGKHLFKPPSARSDPLTGSSGVIVPSYGPSKRVMPEYVVGLGERKAPSRAVEVTAEGGAVGLNHLDDEDSNSSTPDPASLFSAYKDNTTGFDTPNLDLSMPDVKDQTKHGHLETGDTCGDAEPGHSDTGLSDPGLSDQGETDMELPSTVHRAETQTTQESQPGDTSEKPVFKSRKIRARNTRRKSEEEEVEGGEGGGDGQAIEPQTITQSKTSNSDSEDDWSDELRALREGGHSDDELNQVD